MAETSCSFQELVPRNNTMQGETQRDGGDHPEVALSPSLWTSMVYCASDGPQQDALQAFLNYPSALYSSVSEQQHIQAPSPEFSDISLISPGSILLGPHPVLPTSPMSVTSVWVRPDDDRTSVLPYVTPLPVSRDVTSQPPQRERRLKSKPYKANYDLWNSPDSYRKQLFSSPTKIQKGNNLIAQLTDWSYLRPQAQLRLLRQPHRRWLYVLATLVTLALCIALGWWLVLNATQNSDDTTLTPTVIPDVVLAKDMHFVGRMLLRTPYYGTYDIKESGRYRSFTTIIQNQLDDIFLASEIRPWFVKTEVINLRKEPTSIMMSWVEFAIHLDASMPGYAWVTSGVLGRLLTRELGDDGQLGPYQVDMDNRISIEGAKFDYQHTVYKDDRGMYSLVVTPGQSVTVLQGEPLTVTCAIQTLSSQLGQETVPVYWLDRTGQVMEETSDRIKVLNLSEDDLALLQFSHTKAEDAGEYVCRAVTDTEHTRVLSKTVNIHVAAILK